MGPKDAALPGSGQMATGLLIEQALADWQYHDLQATLALGGNWLSAMARVVE